MLNDEMDVALSRRIADRFLKRLLWTNFEETSDGPLFAGAYRSAWEDFADAWLAYQEEKEAARLGL